MPGAVLAGGLKIKKGKLRGVESNGMMCSAVECGLTDTSPGVWVLPPNTPVGVDFIEHAQLLDTVLDVAILPNRGDALSLVGLARECQALYGTKKTFNPQPQSASGDAQLTCTIDSSFCNYYRAQKITGVTNQHTPLTYQTRLYYSGYRPLSWLVDVTNIVMIETGQPLHAFDASNITSIEATYGRGETIELLNEKEVTLDASIPVIKLNNQPSAVAGVMGAQQGEVSHQTQAIILETALFDSVVVRKATKTLGIRSESSNRFEKHVDASGVELAVARVHELLSAHDTITVHSPVEAGQCQATTLEIQIDIARINQFLGTSFSDKDVHARLEPLGFTVNGTTVSVPSYRTNDCTEWPDIAEELCRFSGIEDVTPTPIADMVPINHSAQWRQRQAIQQAALQLGLTEVVPFPLHAPDDSSQPVILNPITPELTVLRSSAIQSLIATAQFNATRHHAPCRLFTIGPVWQSDGTEQLHFAAYVAGPHHHEPHLPAHNRSVDFFSLKGLVEQILQGQAFDVQKSASPALHPGQSADIIIAGQSVGSFGMLHPAHAAESKLDATAGVIEINLSALPNVAPATPYKAVSKFPSTTRDVTYIMDAGVSVGDVLQILRDNKPALCDSINLCGIYQKEGSEDVNASFRMIYQDNEGSLEMAAVNDIHKTFAEEVIQKLPCRFP